MSDFMAAAQDTLNEEGNVSITENGAVGYRTSGKNLVDLNFAVASLRSASAQDIAKRFSNAFFEDKMAAMKWLFFVRDVRGGVGERRLFRSVLLDMAKTHPEYVRPVLHLVPEYGRWDDLWDLLYTPLENDVLKLVKHQLTKDLEDYAANRPISLLAKWMPRCKTSSAQTRAKAQKIRAALGMTERDYQHALANLSRYMIVVEQQMSSGQWDAIEYQRVPSRANLIYADAFMRHDEERRSGFLEKLKTGEARINSSALFPHEIVNKYRSVYDVDDTLEALWNNLPDTVNGGGSTIVVHDSSASMTWVTLPGSKARPLEVADGLAIYYAERSSGAFRNKFITFSERPEFVDLSNGKNLREKIRIVDNHSTGGSTNVEAVFDLILQTAIKNDMAQEDLPSNILIISDMEFNSCAGCGKPVGRWGGCTEKPDARLFDVIRQRYEENGYKLPRLVFWNVASRTGTIPVKENEMGVALVSGFSVNIAKMVMSGKLDPYECLLEQLNTERYQPVEDALRGVIS